MINVTVKTLDSQNHSHSVPDDITVKDFKEWISSSVNIAPDKQRLIYCGRVLQDDKKLSEYNVHEKVIHLVMRAPPQANSQVGGRSRNGASSSSGGGSFQPFQRSSHSSSSSGSDGPHIVVGSVVVREDNSTPTPAPGTSSSGVRLQQAKLMLENVAQTINSLDSHFGISTAENDTARDQAAATSSSSQSDPSENSKAEKSGNDKAQATTNKQPLPKEATLTPSEMDALYTEMDELNNMEAAMLVGHQFVSPSMGLPMMGVMNNSLADGLVQAASAAIASTLSTIPTSTSTSTSASTSTSTTTSSTSSTWTPHNLLYRPMGMEFVYGPLTVSTTTSTSVTSTPSTSTRNLSATSSTSAPPPSTDNQTTSTTSTTSSSSSGSGGPVIFLGSHQGPWFVHRSRPLGASSHNPIMSNLGGGIAESASAAIASALSSLTGTPTSLSTAPSTTSPSTSQSPGSQTSPSSSSSLPSEFLLPKVGSQAPTTQSGTPSTSSPSTSQSPGSLTFPFGPGSRLVSQAPSSLSGNPSSSSPSTSQSLFSRSPTVKVPGGGPQASNLNVSFIPYPPSSSPSTVSSSTAVTSTTTNSTTTTRDSFNLQQPHGGLRGITVRIRSPPTSSYGLQYEHPPCSVMVEVLDQYRHLQTRLEPYMDRYYRIMAEDRRYQESENRQLQSDQWLLWRVSEAMHYLSHAMHAISDIILDLRRPPPRELRARPIIIPQPAIVQTQINANADPNQAPDDVPTSRTSPRLVTSTATASTTTTTNTSPTTTTTSQPDPEGGGFMTELFVQNEVPHLYYESGSESSQNLLSSFTPSLEVIPESSQGRTQSTSSTVSSPTTVSANDSGTNGNSQSRGRGVTNTTNSTQTRVTHRQHVHVTPLHLPGVGMSQFDPFLPCKSHHVRSAAGQRRRHNAEHQSNRAQNSTRRGTSGPAPTQGTSSERPSASASQASGSTPRREGQRSTLQEFLRPFCDNNLFSAGDGDSLFTQLFITIAETLYIEDVIEIFFGDYHRINNLYEPLQRFVRERVLNRMQPSDHAIERAIDEIINDIQPLLTDFVGEERVREGIDYINSIYNLLRHRLKVIINFILNHRDEDTFGSYLMTLVRQSWSEFICLSLHCFVDGEEGLERFLQSIMYSVTPSRQNWFINPSVMLLISEGRVLDPDIRHYVVSPTEGRRMENARKRRMASEESSVSNAAASSEESTPKAKENVKEKRSNDDYSVEAMEIDDTAPQNGLLTNLEDSNAIKNEEPVSTSNSADVEIDNSESIIIGQQPWHNTVPQEWIPVITRDVERQRRGVPDGNLSDAYLRGMPLKRRKISSQSKPHGSVRNVMQDNLRRSLRAAGVSRNLVESVSNDVSCQLRDSFTSHVRSVLRDQLKDNKEFTPDKFPKSEQRIRKKF